jgi:hypothetical protein
MRFHFSAHACALLAGVGLLASQAALAGPGYSVTGYVTSPANAPQVLAAYKKLNDAPIMKDRKSRGMLMANVVDGANPATHSFVVTYPSMADAEAFSAKLYADPAWSEFLTTLSSLGAPAGTMRLRTLRSWGDISDSDVVWANFSFRVTNPAAFLAATERFLATSTGKSIPGQTHLAAIAAGGEGATHVIVAGWASEAEAEAWNDKNANNPEWLAYLAELDLSSEFLGTNISRTLAAAGATLKSTVGQ